MDRKIVPYVCTLRAVFHLPYLNDYLRMGRVAVSGDRVTVCKKIYSNGQPNP